MAKRLRLVRFISPFGSPAWMSPERARQLLEADDRLWLEHQQGGTLSDAQRRIGAPRIETAP